LSLDDSTSETLTNTTACDTIDQDISKLDITMNCSMMDMTIADIQEFKPKNSLSASLNASTFKPFTPTIIPAVTAAPVAP
jgi:hypothetical protein